MKISFAILLAGMIFAGLAPGQTNGAAEPSPAPDAAAGAPSASPALDPARVAEYQRRFQEGYALEKQGQLTQALAIYDGILAEQPDAEHSLLEAGRVCLALNEPLKADGYLEKLHALAPRLPAGLELLIQANQALQREVQADQLVREFRTLRDSGAVPGFRDSLFFTREHVRLDEGGEVVISQYFDYTHPPYIALKANFLDPQHQSQRVLVLKYDPAGTQSVQAKDPKLAHDQVFMLAEPYYTGNRMTKIDVYKELLVTPNYEKARGMLLNIFETSPKPILSEPVDQVEQ